VLQADGRYTLVITLPNRQASTADVGTGASAPASAAGGRVGPIVGDVDESGRREAFRAFCRSLLGLDHRFGQNLKLHVVSGAQLAVLEGYSPRGTLGWPER
jgi:hypothetical protein